MEICVDSMESALNAVTGGAHRLELCSALSEGGLTPSLGLLKTLKSIISVPVFVMLRPRCGNDFHYSVLEIKVILDDLNLFKNAGANGFVFGALTANGNVDVPVCKSVISAARPLPVTFHRAFDVAATDPVEMAQKIADLGFERLLTSGRCTAAIDGKLLIKTLIETMKDRLIVVPGAGINVDNLRDILVSTLASEFHASAKVLKPNANTSGLNLESGDKAALVYITNTVTVRRLKRIYRDIIDENRK